MSVSSNALQRMCPTSKPSTSTIGTKRTYSRTYADVSFDPKRTFLATNQCPRAYND